MLKPPLPQSLYFIFSLYIFQALKYIGIIFAVAFLIDLLLFMAQNFSYDELLMLNHMGFT